MQLSVVVPLFNEQESLAPLIERILSHVRPLGLSF